MKLNNFKDFMINFGKKRYLKLFLFFIAALFAGFLEFIGIALIYPFIMLIISPDIVIDAAYYTKYIQIIGIHNLKLTTFIIGIAILLIFIFKNIYIILNTYLQLKFVNNWKNDLKGKFMKYFIYAPYKDVMNVSRADKMYILTTLASQSIDVFVMRTLNLITNAIIITMIIGILFVKFPLAAVVTIIFVVLSTGIQNRYFKNKTTELAKIINKKSRIYNQTIMEIIGNLKEFKILSAEDAFFKNYFKTEKELCKIGFTQQFYLSIPSYIIEILIVVSLLLLGVIITVKNIGDNSALIASYAVIAAAIFRIAPALNRIQTSIININTSREFVRKINEYYDKFQLNKFKPYSLNNKKRLPFKHCIELKNIYFAYNEGKDIIKNLSLTIEKGDFIGIIGLSGAGKSTFADILTGLLPIKSGKILLDGLELTYKNFPYFRNMIGYVPQQVNVLDKSFKENIAWGIPDDCIDEEGIIKTLQEVRLYDVVSSYEDGLNAKPLINSNGLSQGQKQRLAIARALYRDPEILILDEATSSLDVLTENEITEMLNVICQHKTIIAIAHRLSTLKACNKLVYMKDGCIVDTGTFDELSTRHADFENLVKLSSLK